MNRLSDYNFELPLDLIAQAPLPSRSDSRLLVLKRADSTPTHQRFCDLPELISAGDVLVINDTKVMKARLFGHRADTGGKIEMLLSRPHHDGNWVALLKSTSRHLVGKALVIEGHKAKVLDRVADEPGAYIVSFEGDVDALAEQHGSLPLPPYISRPESSDDAGRYQTVFAKKNQPRAVAAPTAGLHFDEDLLQQLTQKGVHIAPITLHVGPGTFLPVRSENLDEHQMHREFFEVPAASAEIINHAKAKGAKVVAVGTTSVRTLESCADAGKVKAGSGLTQLFIRPGFKFQIVDALITNFHLPKTTLLMLVASCVGKDRLLHAYEEAISERYRFFSYGDACYFDVVPK